MNRLPEGRRAAVARLHDDDDHCVRGLVMELLGFLVIFTCMILMRFGL